jgi:hypothetical protein
MKVSIAVCFSLLIGACAGSRNRLDSGYLAFTHAALTQIEGRQYRDCDAGNCKFTYVVSTLIDPRAREALASIRKVVAPSEVPASAKVLVVTSPNYIEIDKLQIVGETALVEGNYYPYRHNALNCGEGFSWSFKLVNDTWVPQQWHAYSC